MLERPPRSQFLKKLHSLLERPTDPSALRWASETTFEIAIQEDIAIAALRPEFDFRSLGSFVRQLSYYNFKRLSDRRRSSERGTEKRGFIRFTHQSGWFSRGDASQISRITRRPRTQRTRRSSTTSFVSNLSAAESEEREGGTFSAFAWAPSTSSTNPTLTSNGDFPNQGAGESSESLSTRSQAFPTFTPVPGARPSGDFAVKWRNYSPATAGFMNPARDSAAAERQRRASTPVLDYPTASTIEQRRGGGGQQARMIDCSGSTPLSHAPLPSSLGGDRPPMHRANYSTNSIPTFSRLTEIHQFHQTYSRPEEEEEFEEEKEQEVQQHAFREYPTPSFDPSTNVFFTQPTFVPPAPRGATNLPSVPRTGQVKHFLPELKSDPVYYSPHHDHEGISPTATLPSPVDHTSPMGFPSPRLSPPQEVPPLQASYVSLPPQSPPTYFQHYSNLEYTNHVQARQPRQFEHQSNEAQQQGYFEYQQHGASSFAPILWSPEMS
ncbi:uncharacterized protein JCM6883_000239 [Sporobolomyces salmoneus]|uniref:uncharacterized protein n=1 Tax=Sporobolomyces salmoneus TaxID=183962 RepID=UPI00317CE78C